MTDRLAVTDRTAAKMLEMSQARFRKLVSDGALPQPCRIGPEERWPVDTLRAILRGDASRPDEGLEP